MIGAKKLLTFVVGSVLLISQTDLVLAESVTSEEDDFSGSYFCTAEAVGGVRFNEQINAWESYKFAANGRYIVSVKMHSEVVDDYTDKIRKAYLVSIAQHGNDTTSAAVECATKINRLRLVNPFIHFISEEGEFSCNTIGGEWSMNISNGRFLSSYTWGYVDDANSNDNTPNIEIGSCSKID